MILEVVGLEKVESMAVERKEEEEEEEEKTKGEGGKEVWEMISEVQDRHAARCVEVWGD